MQFACGIAVNTVDGEKCRTVKESTDALFAGTVDDRRIGAENGKGDVLDETDRNGNRIDSQQMMHEKGMNDF